MPSSSIHFTYTFGVNRNTKSIRHMTVFTSINEVKQTMLDNRTMLQEYIYDVSQCNELRFPDMAPRLLQTCTTQLHLSATSLCVIQLCLPCMSLERCECNPFIFFFLIVVASAEQMDSLPRHNHFPTSSPMCWITTCLSASVLAP